MNTTTAQSLSLIGLIVATATTAIAQDPAPAFPELPPPPAAPAPAVSVPAPPKAPRATAGTRNRYMIEGGPALAVPYGQAIEADVMTRVGEDIGAIQARSGRSGRTLVVPSSTADPKALAETEEDLNVMARILEKAAGARRGKGGRAMGIPVDISVFGSPAPVRNLYIEGHGALFFVNVSFPLIPPPAKPDAEEPPKKAENTEWENAHREVYGAGARGGIAPEALRGVLVGAGEPSQEFDTNKVAKLKREIIESLMNATHIRQLKPDETVTIVVTGGISGGTERIVRHLYTTGGGGGGGQAGMAGVATIASADGDAAAGRRGESTMVVRAKKSDAVAFYDGKQDFDTFLKKVNVLVY